MQSAAAACEQCREHVFSPKCFSKIFFGIADARADLDGGLYYTVDVGLVVESALRGCTLCSFIASALQHREKAYRRNGRSGAITVKIFGSAAPVVPPNPVHDISMLWVDMGDFCESFAVHAEEGNPAAEYVTTRESDPNVGSPAAFDLAKQWMRECDDTHVRCQRKGVVPLPTRVLDVRPPDGRSGLRLYCSRRVCAPYATLSYCWGTAQPMMTTRSRYSQYLEAIDEYTLPRTIRDAIKITREIGLRFLWVDSLCILQDSPSDKDQEISRMHHIFQNSNLTILAASAPSASVGFLTRGSPPPRQYYNLPYICPGGQVGEIILQKWTPAHDHDPVNDPTNTRAWIFQEHLLSRRLLIYPSAPHSLQWQCRTSQRVNGGPLRLAQTGHNLLPTEFFPEPSFTLSSRLPQYLSARAEEMWRLWASLVQSYTPRALTSPADRLPALAGLASSFHDLWYAAGVYTSYAAGLWSHELPKSLLWHTWIAKPPATEHIYPEEWELDLEEIAGKKSTLAKDFCGVSEVRQASTAPSWSWACTPAGLQINHVLSSAQRAVTHPMFEFLGCSVTDLDLILPSSLEDDVVGSGAYHCANRDSNGKPLIKVPSFSHVKSGTLKLRGAVKRAVWLVGKKKLVDAGEWRRVQKTASAREDTAATSIGHLKSKRRISVGRETTAREAEADTDTSEDASTSAAHKTSGRHETGYNYVGSTIADDEESLFTSERERPVLCLLVLRPESYSEYFYQGLVLERKKDSKAMKSLRSIHMMVNRLKPLSLTDDMNMYDDMHDDFETGERYRRVGLFRLERRDWFEDSVQAMDVDII